MIIALDPGFGNTKVCIDGTTACIQSSVVTPVQVGELGNGLRVAADAPTIIFDDVLVKVGLGACNWGDEQTASDYTTLFDIPRIALFYGAFAQCVSQLEQTGNQVTDDDLADVTLVVGLPVQLVQDEKQRAIIKGKIESWKGRKHFTYRHNNVSRSFSLTITKISVFAQPLGAWANIVWNESGQQNTLHGSEIAVLDIGMNTLDLFVIEKGVVKPKLAGGGDVGFRSVLQKKYPNHIVPLTEADMRYRNNSYKPSTAELDAWLAAIMSQVNATWKQRMGDFGCLVLTGGGASILGDRLQMALGAKVRRVELPQDPVTANVVGLWKMARKLPKGK